LDGLRSELSRGVSVGIRCLAGIGRSPLLAACVLLTLGVSEKAVFPAIGKACGTSVPDTKAQVEWLAAFGRALGGRNGR
jgi:hypothetical protein